MYCRVYQWEKWHCVPVIKLLKPVNVLTNGVLMQLFRQSTPKIYSKEDLYSLTLKGPDYFEGWGGVVSPWNLSHEMTKNS